MASLEELLKDTDSLKEVEGVLKIALSEDCQRDFIDRARDMLHKLIGEKEAKYQEEIERLK